MTNLIKLAGASVSVCSFLFSAVVNELFMWIRFDDAAAAPSVCRVMPTNVQTSGTI